MLSQHSPARIPLLLAALCLSAAGPSYAQTAADLFDDRVLHTLQLTVHSRDWDALRANFTTNDFYPGAVAWNGVHVHNVGVRSRGYGSRSPVKPGLELDFGRYSARGQFLGLRSLVLDNLLTDKAMIRERVAMAFFRRFGVPAPREAFARLFVNGEYMGVYAIVEPVDTIFVQRTLGDGNGALFEYRWLQPFYAGFPGADLGLYQSLFEPRARENDSAFDLYDPIRELFRAINEAPADSVREVVGGRLDLDATLRLVAAETFLAEIDGVLGYAGMNNFYLHRHSTSRRHQLLPWDKDHTFFQWDYPLMNGAVENVMMRRLLEDPALRGRYAELLIEAVSSAIDGDWLANEIQASYGQIREAALADPLKPYTAEEFEESVATIIDFARNRPSFVLAEVHRQLTPK